MNIEFLKSCLIVLALALPGPANAQMPDYLNLGSQANPGTIQLTNPDTKGGHSITVYIDGNQQFYIGRQVIADTALYGVLKKKLAARPPGAEPRIVIQADTAANVKQIIAVMNAARKLKARTVLAVEKD